MRKTAPAHKAYFINESVYCKCGWHGQDTTAWVYHYCEASGVFLDQEEISDEESDPMAGSVRPCKRRGLLIATTFPALPTGTFWPTGYFPSL